MLKDLWTIVRTTEGRCKQAGVAVLLVIAMVALVLVYPLIIVVMYASYMFAAFTRFDAKLTEDGIEVFTRTKGTVARYAWSQIVGVSCRCEPPITYPALSISDGSTVHLECADMKSLLAAAEARGIPVCREPRSVGDTI